MSLNMSAANPLYFHAPKQKNFLSNKSSVRDTGTVFRDSCILKARASELEAHTKYLRSKYGSLTIKSVGKDRKTLDSLGKSMSGGDVVIAPNILEQMAADPEKAAYYEGKIDYFFADIPRQTAIFAAKGLDYQPCGVVVHEDGSVTYISGCADSPERVAQVNAVNKAKREKQAAQRRAAFERSEEAAKYRAELLERELSKRSLGIRPGETASMEGEIFR